MRCKYYFQAQKCFEHLLLALVQNFNKYKM
jgi:hypothetical protein